jgi:hypothetical protein
MEYKAGKTLEMSVMRSGPGTVQPRVRLAKGSLLARKSYIVEEKACATDFERLCPSPTKCLKNQPPER